MTRAPALRAELEALLEPGRVHVVVCPVATGNAPAWGLAKYAELLDRLDPRRYRVFVTGLSEQFGGQAFDPAREHVTSLIDRLDVTDLIALIARADALVAGSSGPLHVAAALGRCAVGIYISGRRDQPSPSSRPAEPTSSAPSSPSVSTRCCTSGSTPCKLA